MGRYCKVVRGSNVGSLIRKIALIACGEWDGTGDKRQGGQWGNATILRKEMVNTHMSRAEWWDTQCRVRKGGRQDSSRASVLAVCRVDGCACERNGNTGTAQGLGESMTLNSFLHVRSLTAWGKCQRNV